MQEIYCVDPRPLYNAGSLPKNPRTLSTLGLSCDRPMLRMDIVGGGQCVLILPVTDGVGCGPATLGPGECVHLRL